MDLEPEKNIYIGKLKELVNDYNGVTGGGFYELVDVLSLSPAEISVLSKYFIQPTELDFSSTNEIDEESLQSLLFKYCRLELRTRALIKKQDRELRFFL
jgi:hypothetical protein